MNDIESVTTLIRRIASLLAAGDTPALRAALLALLAQPGTSAGLRALDREGLLTRIIPELEPARDADQPNVHFLPVLAHSLETVCAVEWLLGELQITGHGSQVAGGESREPGTENHEPTTDHRTPTSDDQSTIHNLQSAIPVAVLAHPDLRYRSAYAEELRRHFAADVGGESRVALFKLAALLHDVAKPATRQPKPGGGVSFHDHQTIGGEVALEVARRLGLGEDAARYIRLVVREHMRPGQFAALDQVTLRAVTRFFHATAGAGPDVLLHMLADHMATRGPRIDAIAWRAQAGWVDALLDTIWGEQVELTPPLLNGDELMRALNIAPGPLVGRLLAAIGEAQAGGEITTSEEAIDLAKRTMGRLSV